jgi:hypothetical protein
MSINRGREETPELPRQDSFSPEVKRVKAETYQLAFGPFIGMTLDEVSEEYFLEIAEDEELVESQPGLLRGLMQWSNAFGMDVGGYYGGQLLKDTPIAWINTWLYSKGHSRSPRMSVALRYHFMERKPEKPGSKWEFSFGKNVGRGFHNLLDQNLPRTYDDWAKSAGMGTNTAGKDDVAEVLVYNEKCKITKLLREYPNAPKYCFRWHEAQRGFRLYSTASLLAALHLHYSATT